MKTLIAEFDDLHFKSPENCLPTIYKYIDKYPNIKLSFFTVPKHSGLPLSLNPGWCKEIRELCLSNNIAIGVHGLLHAQEEFKNKSYNDARAALLEAEQEFALCGIPYKKVFRGPHWGISFSTFEALIDLVYTHCYSHEDYVNLNNKFKDKIKIIYYNWNLKDECAPCDDVVVAHGHTFSVCSNGINETFDKVCNFIDENNPEFKFTDEI